MYMKKVCLVGINVLGLINLILDIMFGLRIVKIFLKKISINVVDVIIVLWKIFKNVGNFKLLRFFFFLLKNGVILLIN